MFISVAVGGAGWTVFAVGSDGSTIDEGKSILAEIFRKSKKTTRTSEKGASSDESKFDKIHKCNT